MFRLFTLVVFSFLFIWKGAIGQKTSTQEYLFKELSEQEKRFLSLEQREEKKPSWIDKLEVRSETDDFEFSRQRYSVRLSPTPLGVRSRQKKILDLMQEERKEELIEFLVDLRHEYCTAYYEDIINKKIYDLKVEELGLRNRKYLGYKKMLTLGELDIQKLLKLEQEILIDSMELSLISTSLKEFAGGSELMNMEWIEIKLAEIEVKNLEKDIPALDVEKLDEEYKIESLDENRVLDFVQLEYRGPHDNPYNERISLGLGLELPFSNNNDFSKSKIFIEKEKALEELEYDQELNTIKKNKLVLEVREELNKYLGLKKILNRMTSKFERAKQINNSTIQSTIASLEYQLNIIDLEKKKTKQEEEVILTYLELLKHLSFRNLEQYISFLN